MTDQQWKVFFESCARVLGAGVTCPQNPYQSI
jgi:hypothetical protein